MCLHVFKCVTGVVMKWLCKALAAYVQKSVFNPEYESQVLTIISYCSHYWHWLCAYLSATALKLPSALILRWRITG